MEGRSVDYHKTDREAEDESGQHLPVDRESKPGPASDHDAWPPLVRGLTAHVEQHNLGFHMPGHHQGRAAWAPWRELLGEAVFSLDLTELPGLDNIQDPQGIIRSAAAEAAAFFGAAETHLLVNGASAGILAALLATCREGDRVLMPRNCHQSVVHGLVLSGAAPIYLPVHWHPGLGLPGMLQTADLQAALDTGAAVNARLLVLLHPNYYGLAGDLAEQIALAHRRGLQVLVDEAHGSHFGASSLFPAPALKAGADYAVHGAHKTLGAFTQAALLHCRDSAHGRQIARALRLVQTTSPSYLLMASLDVARHQLQHSKPLWEETANLGLSLRQEISRVPGLQAPGAELPDLPGVYAYDPSRLVVNVSGLGITGMQAAEWLWQERCILVEMADLVNLVFILVPGDLGPAAEALLDGLQTLAVACGACGGQATGGGQSTGENGENGGYVGVPAKAGSAGPGGFGGCCGQDLISPYELPIPCQALTPRQAFFAPGCQVPLKAAVGKVAAETITPYPPGIPVICPGEVIDNEVLECLVAWRRAGGAWPGMAKGMVAVVDGS